jgi:hypothetical protein
MGRFSIAVRFSQRSWTGTYTIAFQSSYVLSGASPQGTFQFHVVQDSTSKLTEGTKFQQILSVACSLRRFIDLAEPTIKEFNLHLIDPLDGRECI